ncbi:gamma carbonic anhydrase family protein [Granulosicoccaceae sp. 1_MG-2023]|nr:gamma carbonic anhydrase family protein [Granulosicoccaceae sp. 1_MG-2023]
MSIRAFKGMTPRIDPTAFIDDSAVVIGDAQIGAHSSVWPCAVIRADVQSIRIGSYTSVQDNATLHVTHSSDYTPGGNALQIGDYVTIAHGAVIHGCTIGNEVLIGMQAAVLDRAVIEDGVMIGAGTIVGPGKHLKSGFLYVGSPVRALRELSDEEKTYLRYVAENYVRLKEDHRA